MTLKKAGAVKFFLKSFLRNELENLKIDLEGLGDPVWTPAQA